MTGFINRLLGKNSSEPRGAAFAAAMSESGELLKRMEEASVSSDVVRSLMASIWMQRHNVPFMVTVHEAIQEMQSPMLGTEAKAPPLGGRR